MLSKINKASLHPRKFSKNWLNQSLKIHIFPSKMTNFLLMLMKKWETSLHISARNETISTNLISIINSLIQGDCPSELLFILYSTTVAANQRIKNLLLHRSQKPKNSISFFMDNIKLYANKIRTVKSSQTKRKINTIRRYYFFPAKIFSKPFEIKNFGKLQSNEVDRKEM